VAGQLKISFWNVEGLRSKIRNTNFIDYLTSHDIFGIAEGWMGGEVFAIKGFNSYLRERRTGDMDETWGA
jgi:hypothetical protein